MYKLLKSFLTFFCILFLSLPVNAGIKQSSSSVQKSSPGSVQKSQPTIKLEKKITPVNQISLSVQDIVLKNNLVHVTIASSKKLTPAEYNGFMLHVTTPKLRAGKKWTLLAMDTKRSLSHSLKPVVFNTKITMSSPGLVRATLSKGAWKSSNNKSLIPTKKMVAKQNVKKTTKTKKIAEMKTLGKAPQVKPGSDKLVVPMMSEDNTRRKASSRVNSSIRERVEESSGEGDDIYRNMGINISLPVKGHNFEFGDKIYVQYSATGEMVEDGQPITFRLMRGGLIVDTKTRTLASYSTEKQIFDGSMAVVPKVDGFDWRIPATAPTTDHYYIHAIQESSGAVGFGHYFEVSSRFTLSGKLKAEVYIPIDIIEPVADDEVIWGQTRQIIWAMPEEDEPGDCGRIASLYAIKEGTDIRIRLANVSTEPGRNTYDWPVSPDQVDAERYHIEIESSEGCKIRGAAFQIKSCDYAIDSVKFLDGPFSGRDLTTGIDAEDGPVIRDTFRVKVRWNRIEMPSALASGTEWGNRMTVRSKLTNQIINVPSEGINFDYSTAFGSGRAPDGTNVQWIYADVPFEIARDDITHMMTDSRNIPLEFSFEPTGTSVDTDGSNNTFETDMKVSHANIADLQMMFYIDEFSAPRDAHTPRRATHYEYYFTQIIRASNGATTAVGGAPADLLNVPVAWYIEYSTPGDSNWHVANSGRSIYPVVGADWPPISPVGSLPVVEGSFTVPIGTDRTYRLRMVIDPDHEHMDSDRSNNEFKNTLNLPD